MISPDSARSTSTRWFLLAAVVATSVIVGVARHIMIDLQSESIQPSAQVVRSVVASILVFVVGGAPAAVLSGALMRRVKPRSARSMLRCLRYAVAGNLVSLLGGFLVLYFLIWDLAQRMLVLGGLATLGTFAIWVALWVGEALQKRPRG